MDSEEIPNASMPGCPDASIPSQLGFIISTDRYFKRDDVGCIFAVCVADVSQRSLIGAAMVQAVFERAAYGCKLYCCWCAQELDANQCIGRIKAIFHEFYRY